MVDVIDFIFTTFLQIWNVIRASWLLSLFTLLVILGWIVGLINSSRNQ